MLFQFLIYLYLHSFDKCGVLIYFVSDILLHFENIGVRKTDKAYNLVKGD